MNGERRKIKTYEEWLEESLSAVEKFSDIFTGVDERLDYLNRTLLRLEQLLAQMLRLPPPAAPPAPPPVVIPPPEVAPPPEIVLPPVEVVVREIKIPRTVPEPEVILKEQEYRRAGTFACRTMADCRLATRAVVWAVSTLDQDVEIQVIGNIFNTAEGSVALGTWVPLAGRDTSSIAVGEEYWYPYIGVQVKVTTPPTLGSVTVTVAKQE